MQKTTGLGIWITFIGISLMATNGAKRDIRINILYTKALKGKFQIAGAFSYTALILDAKAIGVHDDTAKSYAESVIAKLVKGGHLKL